jgi:hypothetical protein
MPALARAGARWNQDAVLIMRGAIASDATADRNWQWTLVLHLQDKVLSTFPMLPAKRD